MNYTHKPYTLLFVEDEQAIRDNYVQFLCKYFDNVYEAEDGERAYEIYRKNKPHIMIVDINIPKMSGIELVRKIREDDHATKVIMLTAHSDTATLLRATELKLTRYLVKPVTRSELKDALGTVFDELSRFETMSKKVLKLNDSYLWNYERCELYCDDLEIPLTKKEKKVLQLLFSKPEKTHKYEEIISYVWEYEYDDKSDALKTIIKNLRKKLPKESIKNIFAIGYRVK